MATLALFGAIVSKGGSRVDVFFGAWHEALERCMRRVLEDCGSEGFGCRGRGSPKLKCNSPMMERGHQTWMIRKAAPGVAKRINGGAKNAFKTAHVTNHQASTAR